MICLFSRDSFKWFAFHMSFTRFTLFSHVILSNDSFISHNSFQWFIYVHVILSKYSLFSMFLSIDSLFSWVLHHIHLFSHVILSNDSFISTSFFQMIHSFSREFYVCFIYFNRKFLHDSIYCRVSFSDTIHFSHNIFPPPWFICFHMWLFQYNHLFSRDSFRRFSYFHVWFFQKILYRQIFLLKKQTV